MIIIRLGRIFIYQLISQLLVFHTLVSAQNSTNEAEKSNGGISSALGRSMGILVMCLLTAFFYVGFTFLCIRQFRNANNSAANTGINYRTTQRRGLDPAVIDAFPILTYASSIKDLEIGGGGGDLDECAVCLSEFQEGETLRLLTKCSHVFHLDCINLWLSGHVTCPVCRAKLSPDCSEPSTELNAESNLDEFGSAESNQIAIDINDDPDRGISVRATVKEDRLPGIAGRFSRSNSTGHSLMLIQLGENTGRYTLRLTEEIRKQILTSDSYGVKRTRSYSFLRPGEGGFGRG